MLKNRRNWGIALVLVVLLVMLAGCGQTGEQPKGGDLIMLDYQAANGQGFGVINSAGQMIIPPEERVNDVYHSDADYRETMILCDKEQRQCLALLIENHFLSWQDGYRLYSQNYHFYDIQGQLVYELEMPMPLMGGEDSGYSRVDNMTFCFAPDGSLEGSRILVDTLRSDGCYSIYDLNNKLLATRQVFDPEQEPLRYPFMYMELGEEFMAVYYEILFESDDTRPSLVGVDFYDLGGEPLNLGRNYISIWGLWDTASQCNPGYYQCMYQDGPQTKFDILDEQLNVVISGVNNTAGCAAGVMVISRDGVHGLLRLEDGQWLYQEPDLLDYEREYDMGYDE